MRFDSNADLLSDTGGLVDIQGGTWSCLCWIRRIADRNDWTGAWSFHLNTTHFVYLESTSGGGDNLAAWVGSSGGETAIGNVDISDNGWHFVAVTMNGSTVTIYDRAPGETALNSASGTPASPGSAATAFYINDTPWGNEWINGRINAVKVWNRVLTADELLLESNFYMPVNPSSILRVHPLLHADDDEIDYSGNGHTLTVAGTPATEDGPPIQWAPIVQLVGLGSTASGQTISGTVGEITSAESVPSQTIANATPQGLTGTVGEITSAEAFATDHTIAAATPQAITGTVGEIATAESVPSDATISDVVLAITGTVGEISSAESVPSDAAISTPKQTISGTVGEISTAESVPSQTIALSARQTVSGTVGEIATAESVPSQTIANTSQAISGAVGQIATAESIPTDQIVTISGQSITGTVGAISTAESVPSQTIGNSTPQAISGTVGEIATAESVPTDAVISDVVLAITGTAGAIASGESLPQPSILIAGSAVNARPPLGIGLGIGF